MISPFKREWLRSPWFVTALLVVAVVAWRGAVERIRDIQAQARLQKNLTELMEVIGK